MITSTPEGLYCEDGAFHIDPWQPVERAVITHAHGDHARAGLACLSVLPECAPLLRHRFPKASIETSAYGANRSRSAASACRFTRPATSSARRRSGSSAAEKCGSSPATTSGCPIRPAPPFEPVRCHTFITEATFALPIYRWDSPARSVARSCTGGSAIATQGRASISSATRSARRSASSPSCAMLTDGPIHLHGAMLSASPASIAQLGVRLAATERVSEGARGRRRWRGRWSWRRSSARGTPWMRRFRTPRTAFASGLMRVRGVRRQRGFDRGFVLSDHADWPALLAHDRRDRRRARARHPRLVRRAGALSRAKPGLETGTRSRTQIRGRDGRARGGRAEPRRA